MPDVILFNKPWGVLSQFSDREGRRTLADFVQAPGFRPAGRLDYDSEGLLVLCDDGALQARITSPRFKLPKTYLVQVEGEISDAALVQLRRGVVLNDGPTRPAGAEHIAAPPLWERDPPVRFRASIPDLVAQPHAHRGPQPPGAAHDGRGRLPDAAPGALAHRPLEPGGAGERRLAARAGQPARGGEKNHGTPCPAPPAPAAIMRAF